MIPNMRYNVLRFQVDFPLVQQNQQYHILKLISIFYAFKSFHFLIKKLISRVRTWITNAVLELVKVTGVGVCSSDHGNTAANFTLIG